MREITHSTWTKAVCGLCNTARAYSQVSWSYIDFWLVKRGRFCKLFREKNYMLHGVRAKLVKKKYGKTCITNIILVISQANARTIIYLRKEALLEV